MDGKTTLKRLKEYIKQGLKPTEAVQKIRFEQFKNELKEESKISKKF